MSKAQHTRGPWSSTARSAAGYNIISGAFGTDVCVVSKRDKSGSEIDANARLIAAAPELLEALEQCIAHGLLPTMNYSVTETTEKAKAAIAKARGE